MIEYKPLLLDAVKFMTTRHPDVLIKLIIKENIEAFNGDPKKVCSDVVDILAKEHPDVLIELITMFAPAVINQLIPEPKAPSHQSMLLNEGNVGQYNVHTG